MGGREIVQPDVVLGVVNCTILDAFDVLQNLFSTIGILADAALLAWSCDLAHLSLHEVVEAHAALAASMAARRMPAQESMAITPPMKRTMFGMSERTSAALLVMSFIVLELTPLAA
tara:strand:+ start:148 stop:495 length:348 start_codon:yes stop_codon:yes gene_type:complete